jgi:LuxR family transcriptional activator of conjugal transfer of Ti plasmids
MNVRPDPFTALCGNAASRPAPVPRILAPLNELLLHLIDTLSLPLEERAARRTLRDFAEDAGFEFFAYLNLRGSESFAVSNYPREWQDRYVQMNYLRIDPVVTRAKHGPPIFRWSAEETRRSIRRDLKQFFRDADQFGIRSGLSISVPVGFKDRMVFTLASGDRVVSIHSRLAAATQDAALSSEIHLSPREAECLRWFADGMTMPDIAQILGIGYRSVRSYLDEATQKLGAANSRQAATIAIRLGLI